MFGQVLFTTHSYSEYKSDKLETNGGKFSDFVHKCQKYAKNVQLPQIHDTCQLFDGRRYGRTNINCVEAYKSKCSTVKAREFPNLVTMAHWAHCASGSTIPAGPVLAS